MPTIISKPAQHGAEEFGAPARSTPAAPARTGFFGLAVAAQCSAAALPGQPDIPDSFDTLL